MKSNKHKNGKENGPTPYEQMLNFFTWLSGWHYKYSIQEHAKFAIGDWLNSISWTYWTTFTTDYELTLLSARRMAENIANFCINEDGLMFWVAEKFDVKDGHHIHALIKTSKDMRALWRWVFRRYGRTEIKKYNPKLGAGHYCAKYITQPMTDYDFIIGRKKGSSR